MQDFPNKLITWYLKNGRDLPWRKTRDPYCIWLSEIILQQTRVAQGLPYYLRFIEAYPTVIDLAHASEEAVLKLWQGLGYYSRARNLHAAAKYVAFELNGVFPTTYKELLKLKGVGVYTASAIASFCFNEPKAVVDGNVYRVLSRVFGLATPINSTKGQKEFQQLADELIDHKQPSEYNQAIMEYGATVCKPKRAECSTCTFQEVCHAYSNGNVDMLPVKLKKGKVIKRYFNYIVPISDDGFTVLSKREGKGIWTNLYEFPLIEFNEESSLEVVRAQFQLKKWDGEEVELYKVNDVPVIHKLSHQHIYANFLAFEAAEIRHKDKVAIHNIKDYPVPVLIANFIEQFSRLKKK